MKAGGDWGGLSLLLKEIIIPSFLEQKIINKQSRLADGENFHHKKSLGSSIGRNSLMRFSSSSRQSRLKSENLINHALILNQGQSE